MSDLALIIVTAACTLIGAIVLIAIAVESVPLIERYLRWRQR